MHAVRGARADDGRIELPERLFRISRRDGRARRAPARKRDERADGDRRDGDEAELDRAADHRRVAPRQPKDDDADERDEHGRERDAARGAGRRLERAARARRTRVERVAKAAIAEDEVARRATRDDPGSVGSAARLRRSRQDDREGSARGIVRASRTIDLRTCGFSKWLSSRIVLFVGALPRGRTRWTGRSARCGRWQRRHAWR